MNHYRKLLHAFIKMTKAFKLIVDAKFNRDIEAKHDGSWLTIAELKVFIIFKMQPDGDALSLLKKDLLNC